MCKGIPGEDPYCFKIKDQIHSFMWFKIGLEKSIDAASIAC